MTMHPERRLNERKVPHRSTYINLDADYPGILQEISEGGLRFRAIHSLAPCVQIPFWFIANSQRIRGTGDLVWTDEARKIGGVRFTKMSEETRDQIRGWLSEFKPWTSATSDSSPDPAAQGASSAFSNSDYHRIPIRRSNASPHSAPEQFSVGGPTEQSCPDQAPRLNSAKTFERLSLGNGIRPKTRSPFRPILIVGIVTIIAMASYGYYRMGGEWIGWPRSKPLKAQPVTVPPEKVRPRLREVVSETPARLNPVTPPLSHAQMIEPAAQNPPGINGGFVVQVAAVQHKASAPMLVERLRERGLPVFVRDPTTDGFYRVLVGPYPDEKAARVVQRELRQAGYESFVRR